MVSMFVTQTCGQNRQSVDVTHVCYTDLWSEQTEVLMVSMFVTQTCGQNRQSVDVTHVCYTDLWSEQTEC